MVMQEQARRLSEPLHWGRRERTIVAIVLGCVALAAIGLGAFAISSGGKPRKDCIEVTFASTLGGATEHACGQAARRVCASSEGFAHVEGELRAACLLAGFPFTPRRR
jgi:hypothetical protein